MKISEALAIAIQHHRAGRLPAAEEIYRRILAVEPNQVDALHLAGVIAFQKGELLPAMETIQRAIRLDESRADFHNSLGGVYRALGRTTEAIDCHRHAIQLQPDYAEAYINLATNLQEAGQLPDAIACYRRAVELKPGHAKAHNNLGTALRAAGQPYEAADCYRQAISLAPEYVDACNNLGGALHDQGETVEAESCYRRVLAMAPEDSRAHSNLLSIAQFLPATGLAELAQGCAEFERRHAAQLRSDWRPHDNSPDPERTLRLGFVSADFGRHPVGYFLMRTVENLDPLQTEVYGYSDRTARDDLTDRFQHAAAAWRDIAVLNDQQLAEQIRADRIDILFDLAGHTAGNRLMCFARKPAPLQLSWIGCEGTVGLEAIDGVLADRFLVAEGEDRYYREKVLRLPDAYTCYDPPSKAPPVTTLPALVNGHVTFGSFNNPSKINRQVLEVWAEILRRVPGSRLVLKYAGLADPRARKRIEGLLAEAGGDPAQLELRGWSDYEEMLSQYGEIDLALDTFPFCGGATTCEALWMGVPVVTCPGQTWPSRRGTSLLSAAGENASIASDLNDYIETAAQLATDLPRLAAIRAGLRPLMADSPLCDGRRFARNLTEILRHLWQQWCHPNPQDARA